MKRISDLILYKDHHLIAINKPAGMPSQEDPSGETSAHRMVMAYAHRDLFIVHRIDRRVSGALVFAKTKAAASDLSKQWEEHKVKKTYLGIVPISDIPQEGQLLHYLAFDNKQNVTHAHTDQFPGCVEARLHYKIIQQLDNFMVLQIDLISGRKHQIRAQLAAAGIPIRGDIKYGSKRTNPDGAIDLHAYELNFQHPARQEFLTITAPVPASGLWSNVNINAVKHN